MKKFALSLGLCCYFVLFYLQTPSFSLTTQQSTNLKKVISEQDDLISLLNKQYKQARLNEKTSKENFKITKLDGFFKASRVFALAKEEYEKAVTSLVQARSLLEIAINNDLMILVKDSQQFIDNGIKFSTQGVTTFEFGLYLFKVTLKDYSTTITNIKIEI